MSLLLIALLVFLALLLLAGVHMWKQTGVGKLIAVLLFFAAGLIGYVAFGGFDLHAAVHPASVHQRH